MNREDWQNLPLGQETRYESKYNPALLHPIPRAVSRAQLGLDGDALPFSGADEWWGFELSWLNRKGVPQVAVARFRFAASSPFMIESKSFKLYLNSLNQSEFESREAVCGVLEQDLSAAAGSDVAVTLYDVESPELAVHAPAGTCVDHQDIEARQYQPDAGLLRLASDGETVAETLYSHLLRSNCPVTGQPDWATVSIEYTGPALDRQALLAYIISFREHQDFHEHCVERIYCDLQQLADFEYLTVCARYTRRGGLDINPLRTSTGEIVFPGRFARQ
ncbi:NADPH-dependent 7-cyano-7-deazaguanine reductase QueF [Microbulbifer sp. ALW1]|uniref:NADPH-dependent 7-cyano-7-deazaguanine reductase QueF n=1 Tax=Microbulbifer sp. (strain ALW1) TaxID=1516059 RepID=UPI001357D276|nr:NADPH-dependent 7-cyano-7-deazaguanine reductase QueF [Microbulbifer sp. ALW1]